MVASKGIVTYSSCQEKSVAVPCHSVVPVMKAISKKPRRRWSAAVTLATTTVPHYATSTVNYFPAINTWEEMNNSYADMLINTVSRCKTI